jgi:uroporphyrinogen decarboxylase
MRYKYLILGAVCLPVDYQEFMEYINQIIDALAEVTPVIVFGKGWFALNEMGKVKASALGVD